MKVDKNLISKLENLARLELTDFEREEIKEDLEKILKMVNKLEELDTAGIKPLIHMSDLSNRYREDKVDPDLAKTGSLENAPKRVDQYFSVPKVLDQNKIK